MASIAIRYRPKRFEEVLGQELIAKTLRSAVAKGRLSSAYIFAGPRGVGKTSTARILARAVNCLNPEGGEPCNECENCREILKGSHPDVLEIDAASNRGIDQIRELRESVYYLPAKGRKRVYIIDEFHMLTKEAFNALLKTLEEPPEHALFILATTEIDRIPPTILSRCQKFIFRRIPEDVMVSALASICEKEGVEYEEEALRLVALSSEGCMRDAEVMLEQLIALGEGRVELKTASEFLGVLPLKEIKELLKTAFSGDKEALLSKVGRLEEGGYNPVAVAKRLLEATEREFISPSFLSEEECVAAFKILSDCLKELPHHPYPYTLLLFYLYRLSYFKEVKRLSELLKGKALKLEEERGEPEEREKKIKYDTLEAYIAEVIDEGNRVRVVAAHSLGFSKLKERLRELREKYGKEVLVEPPSESSTRKREISKESKELVSKLAKALEAKVLYWEPKET